MKNIRLFLLSSSVVFACAVASASASVIWYSDSTSDFAFNISGTGPAWGPGNLVSSSGMWDFSTCKLKFTLVASNAGSTKSSAFTIVLWPGQGSAFNSAISSWPAMKKVKALEPGKAPTFKLTERFTGNLAGAYIYATDMNNNVLASSLVPASQ